MMSKPGDNFRYGGNPRTHRDDQAQSIDVSVCKTDDTGCESDDVAGKNENAQTREVKTLFHGSGEKRELASPSLSDLFFSALHGIMRQIAHINYETH